MNPEEKSPGSAGSGEAEGAEDAGGRISRERLRGASLRALLAMFASFPDAVVLTSPDRFIVACNPAAEQLFGYEPGELVGQLIRVLYAREEDFIEQGRLRYRDEGPLLSEGYAMLYRRKDGRTFWSETRGRSVRGEGGEMLGFVGLIRDPSEHEAIERLSRLQQLTAGLSSAVTSAEVARFGCQVGAEATGAQFAALWTLGAEGVLELAGSYNLPPEVLDSWGQIGPERPVAARQVMRTGEPLWIASLAEHPVSAQAARDAQGAGIVAVAAVPLRGHRSSVGMLALSYRSRQEFPPDQRAFIEAVAAHCGQALERARLLQEAQEIARRAQEAARLKDEFVATMSHELRTPLNAILGWSSILGADASDPVALRKGLGAIHRNAHAQARLVDDLLDISRIITGKMRIDPRPVDLLAAVRQAIEVVRPSAVARSTQVHLLSDEEPVPLVVDPERLQQIAWNLLSNAIKFTPAGGSVWVEIGRGEGEATLRVTDSGEGIAADFLPHVFDRFRQADSSTTRRHGGLGLGLSIVRHLVELHGGRVEARSEGRGKGASFVVVLPLGSARSWGAMSSLPPAPAPPSLVGVRVLVVDDDEDARELVQALLERAGATVAGASSSREALAVLGSFAPDVLVSDVGMPEEDGYGLLRRVRALDAEAGGRVPAVALTAYTRLEDQQRALDAGFTTHLPKPIDPVMLLGAVANLAALRARV